MVGNVWEWCSSLHFNYPYQINDGREVLRADGWRILRGGSWMDHEWGVRAAAVVVVYQDEIVRRGNANVLLE